MSGYKRRKCFCILLFFLFGLTGCEAEYTKEFLNGLGLPEEEPAKQVETITLDDVYEAAEGNDWITVTAYRVSFEKEDHDTYAYDSLTDAEKLWYEDINELLAYRNDEGVALSQEGFDSGLTEESVNKIYQCVLMDHPEYFYVDGYEYTRYTVRDKLVGIKVNGTYTLETEECIQRKAQIEEAVDRILEQVPADASDYEKIKFVYEYIIFHTEYDLDAPDNQNIYSVFVGEASVCQGYAKATQYLLNRMGVECTLVFGEVNPGEAHSWNLVKSGENYYYLDTTWGDASYTSGGMLLEEGEAPDINYDYLCITSKQLFQNHILDNAVELPVCDSMEDNYYVREGCYFVSCDEAQLQQEFDEAFMTGQDLVTIKCDSDGTYQEMYEKLIENQQVFEYLDSSFETIAYIQDAEQLTLTFWVTK